MVQIILEKTCKEISKYLFEGLSHLFTCAYLICFVVSSFLCIEKLEKRD